ncbi:hypothetical protein [Pseudogemmobacter blasticus]|uniref:hypothetical protein n=1 Tax=Fuscovulum blasticum TaxID=1075 RepID=UPI0015E739CD|nr:hypothetical protein [Fuscovulum blasticum]
MSRKRKAAKVLSGRFTAMPHYILDCPAYKALPPLARCIYWHLHRLAGVAGEKNGEVFYSVRNAAEDHGVGKDRANRAFDDLQAKGFILPERIGHLGIEGQGKATTWRLTHFRADRDFLKWSDGRDFPVAKKQKPVLTTRTALSSKQGQSVNTRDRIARPCPQNKDVSGAFDASPVLTTGTYKDIPSGRASPVVRLVTGGRGD